MKVGGKGVIAGLVERPAIGRQRGSGLEVGQVAPGSLCCVFVMIPQVKVGGKGVSEGLAARPAIGH